MPKQTPFPKKLPEFETFGTAMKRSQKRPALGVTQGGSSKKFRGAQVAATSIPTTRKRSK